MKMKLIIMSVFLLATVAGLAVEDSLMIVLKNGTTDIIPISGISKITFVNVTGVASQDKSKGSIDIKGNYPNPFNNYTDVLFESSESTAFDIRIYNSLSQRVFTTSLENEMQGVYRFRWDGTDTQGIKQPEGVYFLEIRTGKEIATTRLIIIR